MKLLNLSKPLRPFPVADRTSGGELYETMHPRLAAIRLLREHLAEKPSRAGLDPYDSSIFLLQARVDERVWAHRALELTGIVLGSRLHGDGVRLRAILEADVLNELGLDQADAPTLDDEPLASRAADSPVLRAIETAKDAYDRRFPGGVFDQEVH